MSAESFRQPRRVAKTMNYKLKRVDELTRFLEDGRICPRNNAAERELRGRFTCILADVLPRSNDHAIHRLDELLPWNWAAGPERRKVAA